MEEPGLATSLVAHLRTVWPVVRSRLAPPAPPPGEPWELVVDDPDQGPVRLGGELRRPESATTAVVFVHGLGGHRRSRYVVRAARAADALGLAVLRFDCRGSDRRGEDVYHAGMTSDLHAIVGSPAFADFERVVVLGFSLGGHLALRLATDEGLDPRIAAVAAVCSPLDLSASARMFDRPSRLVYRRYVMAGLADIYAAYAARHPGVVSAERVAAARGIREFDSLVVIPRFGFADPDDYYARESVGPRLDRLQVPAILVASPGDPMVHVSAVGPALDPKPDRLEVHWIPSGGHVAFPRDLDLGLGPPFGLESQVLRWLLAAASRSR